MQLRLGSLCDWWLFLLWLMQMFFFLLLTEVHLHSCVRLDLCVTLLCCIRGWTVVQTLCYVLTATHHSHGSPRLSDFFPAHPWRSDPLPTDLHAKWLNRRGFTWGCAFCSKNRNFSYPLISTGPLKSNGHVPSRDPEMSRSWSNTLRGQYLKNGWR